MNHVKTMAIRMATPADAEALLAVYAPYVQNTAVTFETAVPVAADFRRRIAATLPRYPYLVAQDARGVAGYAYTGAFVGRAAYAWSAEVSIYLAADRRGRGWGRRLYAALETLSRAQASPIFTPASECRPIRTIPISPMPARPFTRIWAIGGRGPFAGAAINLPAGTT